MLGMLLNFCSCWSEQVVVVVAVVVVFEMSNTLVS